MATSTRVITCVRSASLRLGAGLGVGVASLLAGCASEPEAFETPDLAVNSLVSALRTDDTAALERILGSEADEVLSSGDEVADANGRAEFLRLYDEKNRLAPDGEDYLTLEVGATDWPLPIPVVRGEQGWYFDTPAGLDEMLSRRIGRNELYAIQVCLAIVEAQREYATADFNADGWREYARTFNSEPGKKNGLYWPAAAGEPESPLGEFVATATEEGYGARGVGEKGPRPYHGYMYRILTSQGPAAPGGEMDYVLQGHMIGGFGVIAWPADYANSGLKSFIVSHHGVVYEKDLGDDTDRMARNMQVFNPDAGWQASDTSIVP
jgi:hypothetical protein